jgi:hypothetical protein
MYGNLVEHIFDRDGKSESIHIHPGKDAEKTAKLVAAVLNSRDHFNSRPGDRDFETVDVAVDTDCLVTSGQSHRSLSAPGTRIFDLACAYGSDELVAAMMRHPDTPVGQIFGILNDRHSALTFLATAYAEREPSSAHKMFYDNALSRERVFQLLISDPRTPVDYRVDAMDGGRTLDVLGILRRYRSPNGMAYHPVVSQLLWQRKAAIATHWDFANEMRAAWTAASDELLKDDYLRHMDGEKRQSFLIALQADIENQYGRTSLAARFEMTGRGIGAQPKLSRIDQRHITENIGAVSANEALASKIFIARQIWIDSAELICLKEWLIGAFRQAGPNLQRVADTIDRALKPAP